MLTIRSCAIAAAAAAAIALTSFTATPASAGRRGDAVALGAIVGLFGTVAAIAAANAHDRRESYYRPRYVQPGYGGRYIHGPVHRGPRWDGWHRHHRYR